MAADPAIAARRAAVAQLSAVLEEGVALAELAERADGPLSGLPAPDRARAHRLTLAVLREMSRADARLKPFLRKPPPPHVRNVLRLAAVEMGALGEDPHGVVHSAVALLRSDRRSERYAALANAVLRRAADEQRPWLDLPPQRLPGWIRGRLSSAYGGKAVGRIEAVHGVQPSIDLTPRDPADAAQLTADLGADLLPTGSLRLTAPGRISALPGFEDGRWWVQDAAAAMAARVLDPQPGETVLDLCAAPGGKSLQLAAAGARVTALDVSDRRLDRLRENLNRTGLQAEIIAADALTWPGGQFDAILLDAPCSATGTIRRHPDLPFVKSPEQLKPLVALQAAMFDRALDWLKPGGRIVYCTCSLLTEEGEVQAKGALDRHPSLQALPDVLARPGVDPAWIGELGLRLRPDYWPERGGMDGFFIAAFRKGA